MNSPLWLSPSPQSAHQRQCADSQSGQHDGGWFRDNRRHFDAEAVEARAGSALVQQVAIGIEDVTIRFVGHGARALIGILNNIDDVAIGEDGTIRVDGCNAGHEHAMTTEIVGPDNSARQVGDRVTPRNAQFDVSGRIQCVNGLTKTRGDLRRRNGQIIRREIQVLAGFSVLLLPCLPSLLLTPASS